jgi:hypothetical protein
MKYCVLLLLPLSLGLTACISTQGGDTGNQMSFQFGALFPEDGAFDDYDYPAAVPVVSVGGRSRVFDPHIGLGGNVQVEYGRGSTDPGGPGNSSATEKADSDLVVLAGNLLVSFNTTTPTDMAAGVPNFSFGVGPTIYWFHEDIQDGGSDRGVGLGIALEGMLEYPLRDNILLQGGIRATWRPVDTDPDRLDNLGGLEPFLGVAVRF